MVTRREWLNWDEACLPQAAAWIVDRFARGARASAETRAPSRAKHAKAAATLWDDIEHVANAPALATSPSADGFCDLRHVLCVLPGRRAGRMLLGELLRVCKDRGLRLVPSRVLTPGAMVDDLLAIDGPVASDVESHLAWIAALRECEKGDLRPLLPDPPARDDVPAWSDLARTIQSLHDELAGEIKTFESAADQAERLEMPGEGERWRALESVRTRYRRALRDLHLLDSHEARERALQQRIRDAAAGSPSDTLTAQVILIGVVDLNALQRAVLSVIAADVTALVHAPTELAEMFDDLGTPHVEKWAEHAIDIDDEDIIVAERPVNQAQAALRAIAQLDSTFSASQITFGLGDAALLGDLSTAATWAGLEIHNAAGQPLSHSAPWRLLHAAGDWLQEDRFEHLATLLRHPDVERYVLRTATVEDAPDAEATASDSENAEAATAPQRGREEWLTLLDEYFAEHLQGRFAGTWLGDAGRQQRLKAVHDAVQAMLAPLRDASRKQRPLHEWCQALLDVLANVYAYEEDEAARIGPPDLRSIDACLEIRGALEEVAIALPGLSPQCDAVTALRMLLDHCVSVSMSEDLQPHMIETLGWLELHLDPAPALIITGFNDRHIPESVTADAFLPDGLRTRLGLMNNARRYARDAYLLQAIARSRTHLRLIVGRRDALDDPLMPSRLLLACDDQALVRRVERFAQDLTQQASPPPIGLARAGATSRFVIPEVPRALLQAPGSMSVTEFKRFLDCPYRYALEKLLRLKCFDDGLAELNPMSFGSLAHDVLCTLGDASIATSEDRDEIFEFLKQRLGALVRERFGKHPLPAMLVQIARLEQRFWSFSAFQARSASEGWRIRYCEVELDKTVCLDVPGDEPMPLRARIDRIDEHPETGRWRVIDYKTGERGDDPIRTHHAAVKMPDTVSALQWRDLQLPLYYLLVTQSEQLRLPAASIELGYIVLPRQSDGARWHTAPWTPAHLQHGLDAARQVVRDIRAAVRGGKFEINRDIDSRFDDFARICQTTTFSAADCESESEPGSGFGGDE